MAGLNLGPYPEVYPDGPGPSLGPRAGVAPGVAAHPSLRADPGPADGAEVGVPRAMAGRMWGGGVAPRLGPWGCMVGGGRPRDLHFSTASFLACQSTLPAATNCSMLDRVIFTRSLAATTPSVGGGRVG